ncbi:hypothetical protein B0181_04830 [Moraxella caviae]|uniref:Disulfide isomerase/thiol-disulfide oxidase n=1 Tax=Moraxella caviae TaxID=34060 RepID=A0A1T0A382_9GAMM|nr:hypothetical protein [Moraxella caviae]OOR90203.1 hypothetical protein B0181_04830 [Moraxella caviae]STZ14579.1 disulfide isomerase/thiol-disulfide oxidase [Moraxella caviae]VEW12584.1 disulfide isomerase/thiol-disulfide oxidase [Moraxella caviae]
MAIQRKSEKTIQTTPQTVQAEQTVNTIDNITTSKKSFIKSKLTSAILAAGIFGVSGYLVGGYTGLPFLMPNSQLDSVLEEHGTIKDKTTKNGMTEFLLDSPDGEFIVYAPNNGRFLFNGPVYHAKEKLPLVFDKYAEQGSDNANATGEHSPAAEVDMGNILEQVDQLGGYKEDSSKKMEDTVYVFYDPRCPYCHSLFDKTRDIKASGRTIKWLPTVALGNRGGDNSDTMKVAAAGLSLKNSSDLDSMFNHTHPGVDSVTPEQAAQVHTNLQALIELAHNFNGPNAGVGVPSAVYVDNDGQTRFVVGPHSEPLYSQIFGDRE